MSRRATVAGAFFVGALGCASVPAAPGGPLQRSGTFQLGGGLGVDVANSRVTTTTTSERQTHFDAGFLMSRLGARYSPADVLDFAVDYGTNGAGGEIRTGRPERAGSLPFAFSLGARTGALIPLTLQDDVRKQWETRARLEVYPRLRPLFPTDLNRVHAIVALGASRGRYFHSAPQGDGVSVLQFEARIEGALGLELRGEAAFLSLVALPYYIARSWRTEHVSCGFGHCYQIDREDLVSYDQKAGGTILVSLGLTLGGPPKEVPDPRPPRY